MTCSRCHARNIPGDAVVCPNCGGTLVAEGPPPRPLPEDLEQALKRDLSGQFQINELLGRGGMSLVYLAYELQLNRPVALKVLPLQLAYGPDAVERFEREAKIAAALDHPHIVPIYRVGATGTFLWYSMKRVKGRSLAEILETSGTLTLEETLGILEQAGSALQYAHRHGVVHRDVKPANIMIEESGWALVCDFGVAKAFGNVALTQSGGALGTPRYMAPEQFEKGGVDGRSDQYSLAIVTYECLSGAAPFTGDSYGELVRKHLLEPAPRITDKHPDIPAHVADTLQRALSKKPHERFRDVAEFVHALGGRAVPKAPPAFTTPPSPAAKRKESRVVVPSPPTVPLATIRRRGALRWTIRGGALAALVAAGAFAWRSLSGPTTGRQLNGQPVRTESTVTVALHDTARPKPADTTPRIPQSRPPGAGVTPSAARGRRPAGTPTSFVAGTLAVNSQPPGAALYVDDTLRGSTPLLALPLAPGSHRLRLELDGFKRLLTPVTITAGLKTKRTDLRLEPLTP